MKLLNAIPALPVCDMRLSIAFYGDKLGFTLGYHDEGFAKFTRDATEVHLWAATDERWKTRNDSSSPVVSGAESFIAGTASCRIGVEGVDEWHSVLQPLGILRPDAQLTDRAWGTREFDVFDPDNNVITFFERT